MLRFAPFAALAALATLGCGPSRSDEPLEDVPLSGREDRAPRAAAPGVRRPAPEALRPDERPWIAREAVVARVLIEGGHLALRASGGDPPRVLMARASAPDGPVERELLLDPASGRVVAEAPALGRWMVGAGVLFDEAPRSDGVLALRRADDGLQFELTVRLPDGTAPAEARVAAHPDADRVWIRGVDAEGTSRVARLDALEASQLVLEHALPGAPGLSRFDAGSHRFEAVIPGEAGTCALARFGEDGCRRRGAWRGTGGMDEIPLADGWLYVQLAAGHLIARTRAEGSPDEIPLAAGCEGYSLVGVLGDPPRVAYQCMAASPPVVRVWSPDGIVEVAYPNGEAAARFFPLDLRVPVLFGPGFVVSEPRRTWIDLAGMRVLEGPPLLAVDPLLARDARPVGVRPRDGGDVRAVVVDLPRSTFADVTLPCAGVIELAARGGDRSAWRCLIDGRAASTVILDPDRRVLHTTDRRVEAILPDGTVIASESRGAEDPAARFVVLDLP